MNYVGFSYVDMGRRDEALKLREEVLALDRKVNGPEHPHTLMEMGNLASGYDRAGRRDEALKLREEVLTLRRKVSGPEHPDTLMAMGNLAFSYAEAGRRDEALRLRKEVLALRRKVNGPEHPDTLTAMGNLAISYAEAGRRDEALKLREEILPLYRKVLGPEHPDTLGAMHNLAISYELAGRLDEAVKLQEEVVALRRKVNGREHPNTIFATTELANRYFSAGRTSEAFTLLAKACEVDPKNYASLVLATWQTWSGQDAAYEATRRRLVEQAEGTDSDRMHRAAKAYCLRPSTDAALLAKALHLAQRSVELAEDSGNPFSQQGLGMAEYRNGQYAAAERTLILAEQRGGGMKDLQGIVRLYRVMSLVRQDKTEEARKLFSQAEAQMPPFPQYGHKPLVEGKLVDQDYLIWWLAYKEAKALIESKPASVAEPTLPK
jgi:tetratricopeptide (TPR) repeat protein